MRGGEVREGKEGGRRREEGGKRGEERLREGRGREEGGKRREEGGRKEGVWSEGGSATTRTYYPSYRKRGSWRRCEICDGVRGGGCTAVAER